MSASTANDSRLVHLNGIVWNGIIVVADVVLTVSQGGESVDDTRAALWTLGEVLLSLTKMMSPFTPFFSGMEWNTKAYSHSFILNSCKHLHQLYRPS